MWVLSLQDYEDNLREQELDVVNGAASGEHYGSTLGSHNTKIPPSEK